MNKQEEALYWYWLYNIEGIGTKTRRKLLEVYQNPYEVFHSFKEEDITGLLIPKKAVENIIKSRNLDIVSKNYSFLVQRGIQIVTLADDGYPDKLRNIYDPPGVLYVRGNLPEPSRITIAVVGARECSNYGKELALNFSCELSERGIQIISGLARGIDSYAHQGAYDKVGHTYAVLGCGIDICYPRENIGLYMDIIRTGGIISEYPPGYQPIQANFPMRNRIISGLSDGILLVEARKKSGSLITMDYGLEQGKNIYACPGRVTDSLSGGTNHAIQMGGKLVLDPNDILEDYGLEEIVTGKNLKKNHYVLEKEEKIVYDCLSLMPKHMEDIMCETGFKMVQISEILLNLQLKGIIRQTAGSYFSLVLKLDAVE